MFSHSSSKKQKVVNKLSAVGTTKALGKNNNKKKMCMLISDNRSQVHTLEVYSSMLRTIIFDDYSRFFRLSVQLMFPFKAIFP